MGFYVSSLVLNTFQAQTSQLRTVVYKHGRSLSCLGGPLHVWVFVCYVCGSWLLYSGTILVEHTWKTGIASSPQCLISNIPQHTPTQHQRWARIWWTTSVAEVCTLAGVRRPSDPSDPWMSPAWYFAKRFHVVSRIWWIPFIGVRIYEYNHYI